MGRLKIIKDNLNVISHVDISYITTHISNINEIIGTVRFVCQQSNNSICLNILSPLTARFHDVKQEYASISHLITKRFKRSPWFGAVGTVFKHVFGTLSEDDALKYDEAINSIQKDEKKLAQFMKENILVTTSALDSFRTTVQRLKLNEESLNNELNNLINKTNNLTKITNNILFESKVHSTFTSLESTLLTLSFRLEDVTNAILLAGQNILHPSILTPSQLSNELLSNDRHILRSTHLPVSPSIDNVHVLLRISTTSCYYYNERLVFVLHIPLVTSDEFNLYHNIALPTPHDSNLLLFSFIIPTIPYTAIAKDKLSFINLLNLDKCKTINVNSEVRLCEVRTVLLTSGNPTCESILLTRGTNTIPSQCVTKTISGRLDTFEPISNNRWIYVQSSPNKVFLECGVSELSEVIVSGTGILNTPNQCTVHTENKKLISSKTVLNISIPIPNLDFYIIKDPCCNLTFKSIDIITVSPTLLKNINLDELTISNKNNELISNLNKIIEEKPFLLKYETPFLTTSSIILIILFFIIAFYFRTCFTKCFKCMKSPIVNAIPPIIADVELTDIPTNRGADSPMPIPRLREVV